MRWSLKNPVYKTSVGPTFIYTSIISCELHTRPLLLPSFIHHEKQSEEYKINYLSTHLTTYLPS
jgi:hypothetical protein